MAFLCTNKMGYRNQPSQSNFPFSKSAEKTRLSCLCIPEVMTYLLLSVWFSLSCQDLFSIVPQSIDKVLPQSGKLELAARVHQAYWSWRSWWCNVVCPMHLYDMLFLGQTHCCFPLCQSRPCSLIYTSLLSSLTSQSVGYKITTFPPTLVC